MKNLLLPSIEEFTKLLTTESLWYLDEKIIALEKFLQTLENERSEGWKAKKEELINILAHLLENEEVQLGDEPEGFNDNDRLALDTIVVHHTHTEPDISYAYINALQLLRLYVPVFRSDAFKKNGEFQPISSGHLYKGKQTFIGYHYLIREDGAVEQILNDKYTGFHAGDYRTNCRSIGVAIVDDLTEKEPSEEALQTLRNLIKQYAPEFVLGHGEVVTTSGEKVATECPGKTYYQPDSWKKMY